MAHIVTTIPYNHYYRVGGPPNLNHCEYGVLASPEADCRLCWLSQPRGMSFLQVCYSIPFCWVNEQQVPTVSIVIPPVLSRNLVEVGRKSAPSVHRLASSACICPV